MRTTGLAAALLVALAASAAAAAQAPVFPDASSVLGAEPPELLERLERQHFVLLEDVEKGEGNLFLAYVLFARPAPRVWELLSASERQSEFRPDLRESLRIQSLPDGGIDEHRMRILFVDVIYRLRFVLAPARARIEWATDPAFENSLRKVEGFWELFSLGEGRALGRFGTVVDVGPALPRSFQDSLTRRSVLRNVKNVRLWVDSDGRWRP
jgi:hypothetical protein